MAIQLPDPNKSSSQPSDAEGGDKTPANDAQAKIDGLTQQLSELTAAHKADAEAKKVEDTKKKAAAEKDAAAELEAQADLKALLDGTDEDDEGTPKSNKLNDLDNTQLMDVVGNAIETCMDARMKQAQEQSAKQFKGVTDSMNKICQFLGQMETKTALKAARDKYPDFDTFKEDTLAVVKKYPMMEIDDAYLLAKQVRKGNSPAPRETDSERPDINLFDRSGGGEGEPAEKTEKKPAAKPKAVSGVVQFRDIVGKAVDKLDIGGGR